MQQSTDIAGLVLCGGYSERMGSDKGLLMRDGLPWCRQVGQLIASTGLQVYYSIRAAQFNQYISYIDPQWLVVDKEVSEGPLRGVASAMTTLPVNALLAVACDMQSLTPVILQVLLDHYRRESYQFYAYRQDAFYQPFPAVYTRTGLLQSSSSGSLQRLLQQGPTLTLPIPEPAAFSNYNEAT